MNIHHAAPSPLALAPEVDAPLFFTTASTCARCGAFGELTTAGDRELCDACLARRHWIETEPAHIGGLLRGVAFLTLRLAPIAIPLLLAFNLPMILAKIRWDLSHAVTWPWIYVHVIAEAAVWGMAAQLMAGEPVRPRKALRAALSAWGRLASTTFAGGWSAFLFSLLLVVPGIYKILGFAAALPIALHEQDHDGASALSMSEHRVRGLRLHVLLGYLVLGTIPIASGVACMIAALYAGALTDVPITIEHAELAGALAMHIAALPLVLLPAVLYAKTRDRLPTYDDVV